MDDNKMVLIPNSMRAGYNDECIHIGFAEIEPNDAKEPEVKKQVDLLFYSDSLETVIERLQDVYSDYKKNTKEVTDKEE